MTGDGFERRWAALGWSERRRISRVAHKGEEAPDAETAGLVAGFARRRLSAWYENPWLGAPFAALIAAATAYVLFDEVSIVTVAGVTVGYVAGMRVRHRRLRAAIEANERKAPGR
ncbi:MAG TPA: hypothetical protein VHJ34_02235 [Actinomycetota bacterium]|nr:hypothetical protein [Actinomycetota bacterium]